MSSCSHGGGIKATINCNGVLDAQFDVVFLRLLQQRRHTFALPMLGCSFFQTHSSRLGFKFSCWVLLSLNVKV